MNSQSKNICSLFCAAIILLTSIRSTGANVSEHLNTSNKSDVLQSSLTIYQELFCIISETRKISLKQGVNIFRIDDIDNEYINDSIHITSKDEGVELLSIAADKHAENNGESFKTVSFRILSDAEKDASFDMFYISPNLTAQIDYKAVIDFKKQTYDFFVNASIRNGSQISIKDADIVIFAQPENSQSAVSTEGLAFCSVCHPTHMTMGAEAPKPGPPSVKGDVARTGRTEDIFREKMAPETRADIAAGGVTDILLHFADDQQLGIEHVIDFDYEFHNEPTEVIEESELFLRVKNNRALGAAAPLLPGNIRIFEHNDGKAFYRGTFPFPRVGVGDGALIPVIMTDPLVTGTKRIVDLEKEKGKLTQRVEVTISNRTSKGCDVVVKIKRLDDSGMIIADSNLEYNSENKNVFYFKLALDAGSDKVIRYTQIKVLSK